MRDSRSLGVETDAIWRLNPRVRLCWRRIAGEWVVFEQLSGQTHKLDDLCAAVLMCHEPLVPLGWPDLIHTLEAEFDFDTTADLAPQLLAATHQLAATGLLIPASLATTPAPTHAAV